MAPSELEEIYSATRRLFLTSDEQVDIEKASVAVLWRRAPRLEVYLVRRALTLGFLPGFWCFPGGKQEAEDAGAAETAVRELKEETGVTASHTDVEFAGCWVTPPATVRFDTKIFFVELPGDQCADFTVSSGELIAGRWSTPEDALRQFDEGRLLMNAPVLALLHSLRPGIVGAPQRALETAARYARHWPRLRPVTGGISAIAVGTPTLPPATQTNCYVVGTEKMVIVDPGTPYPEEREALCDSFDKHVESGGNFTEIWLTHHHRDHVGAAEFVSERYGLPIYAHRNTAELLQGTCRVDRYLVHGERRELNGRFPQALECVFTPGHAAGHCCFWEPFTGALLVGDMIASQGSILIDPSEGDMGDYLESLSRIRARCSSMLLPAHGGPLSEPKRAIDAYIQHRKKRECDVVAALGTQAQSLNVLVRVVYKDTPVMLHGLAKRSLESHLLKLAKEKRAYQVETGWLRNRS